MEFKFVFLLYLLSSVSWVTSNNPTLSNSETYWKSKLPNTPIPESLSDLLPSADSLKQNGSYGATGEGGISLSPKELTCCFCNYWCGGGGGAASVFFTKKELRNDSIMPMTLDLTKSTNSLPLLSRSVAESIPFSLDKLPEILDRFSVAYGSPEANVIKNTIQLCEIVEENKVCVTSLESLADFIKSQVGDEGSVISIEAKGPKVQRYRLVEVVRKVGEEEGEDTKSVVSCHKLNYAYAVFYCHKVHNVSAYMVKLVGVVEDETPIITAVAVCHTINNADLGRKLGFIEDKKLSNNVTICHFLPEDHFLVYKSNNNKVDTLNV